MRPSGRVRYFVGDWLIIIANKLIKLANVVKLLAMKNRGYGMNRLPLTLPTVDFVRQSPAYRPSMTVADSQSKILRPGATMAKREVDLISSVENKVRSDTFSQSNTGHLTP